MTPVRSAAAAARPDASPPPASPSPFVARHVGPDASDVATMLEATGWDSLDALIDACVPDAIRQREPLELPAGTDEPDVRDRLRALAARNATTPSLIGMGFQRALTPAVIQRNVVESPAWYTAYTPYQPEISQGRLEVLLTFQTMVADLTALPLANASLLDESTAAAEAVGLAYRAARGARTRCVVDPDCHPQVLEVVRTRAWALGLDVEVTDPATADLEGAMAVVVSYPGSSGAVRDPRPIVERAHDAGAQAIATTDLLALTLLTPPGELGFDVAVGSSQRFGVPLWYGGPHAGFIATGSHLQRLLPGRLVGVSVDSAERPALRLALQTREQHIRREKATSNICTAQSLPAIVAALYACYHGPSGLEAIAQRVHALACGVARALSQAGMPPASSAFFDTLTVAVPGRAEPVVAEALRLGLNLRLVDADHVGIAFDETCGEATALTVLQAFGVAMDALPEAEHGLPESEADLWRTSPFLANPVFHAHRSETGMLRYLRALADKDLALDRTMIPLGSCTMKLNATAEMEPVTWPGFTDVHPFAPRDQAAGYLELIGDLERWLAEITGYDAVSLQPNAGSQGELAGLLAIRRYHEGRDQAHRTVCLIPSSAHGTNAASATMAGLDVVVVACDDDGDIDLDDLEAKAARAGGDLAAAMITYPSTHGVYEAGVTEVCRIVHDHGGQVYLDGANLNALVGLARPGRFGADVSHLNLHKTFCIPHGGGGPGVGPVALGAHLAEYLPSTTVGDGQGPEPGRLGAISGTPYGSAGILPVSWAYMALMGPDGLAEATRHAVLNANYLATRLAGGFDILYTGAKGTVAHECIIDVRPLTLATGVTAEDVAKRLVDFGFHAPTMSFPVAGTLMVEPTESEPLAELDRFCDAMLAIRAEIAAIERGDHQVDDSPLRHAPHTAEDLVADDWSRPYSRRQGAYPTGTAPASKYWPPVGRVDNPHGDRNLVCACPPVELTPLG